MKMNNAIVSIVFFITMMSFDLFSEQSKNNQKTKTNSTMPSQQTGSVQTYSTNNQPVRTAFKKSKTAARKKKKKLADPNWSPCNSDSQCDSGHCVMGQCQDCVEADRACSKDNDCCSGNKCIEGNCCSKICGGAKCCTSGQTCMSNQCCPNSKVCGSKCCGDGYYCLGGMCQKS